MAPGDKTGQLTETNGPRWREALWPKLVVVERPAARAAITMIANRSSLAPSWVFLAAVWFGLAAGLVELALLVLRVAVLGQWLLLAEPAFSLDGATL